MHKTNNIQALRLRFHRWSRKGFAAFCSIGKCVVIARVKNSIANASIAKNKLSYVDPAADCSPSSSASYPSLWPDLLCPELNAILSALLAVEMTQTVSFPASVYPYTKNIYTSHRHHAAFTPKAAWCLFLYLQLCLFKK